MIAEAHRLFYNGGWPADVALALAVLGLVFIAMRGRKTSPAWLFAVAAVPFVVSLVATVPELATVVGYVYDGSVYSEVSARILAGGIGETLANDILGGLAFAVLALAAAAVAPRAKPASRVLVAGALWLVATLAVAGLRLEATGLYALLPALVVAAVVVIAWSGRDARGVVILALAATLATQRAFEASLVRDGFTAVANSGIVSDAERARILVSLVAASSLAPVAYAVHVVFGTLTFAAKPSRSMLPSGALAVVLAAGVAAIAALRAKDIARLRPPSLPNDITLPQSQDSFGASYVENPSAPLTPATVHASAAPEPIATPCVLTGQRILLFADKDATMGAVNSVALRPNACQVDVMLALGLDRDVGAEQKLGAYRHLLGRVHYLAATWGRQGRRHGSNSPLVVASTGPSTITIDGRPVALPLPDDFSLGTTSGSVALTYRFRAVDTVAHAIEIITGIEQRMDGHIDADSSRSIELAP